MQASFASMRPLASDIIPSNPSQTLNTRRFYEETQLNITGASNITLKVDFDKSEISTQTSLECNYCNKIIDTKEANSLSDTLLGDTDGDGEVTILDATAIQRQLASIPTFAYIEAAADTDGNGEIAVIDATYIQRWLVNLKSNDNIGKPLNK